MTQRRTRLLKELRASGECTVERRRDLDLLRFKIKYIAKNFCTNLYRSSTIVPMSVVPTWEAITETTCCMQAASQAM
ncbi:unnamed protein product [Cylicostephanus goldi]|uniref:Uncharacterized protein n=1 Tax=Cylicostephanus goldi TaxID=71465 RepID=A0A3P7QAF2_CYLGO|nr:unnamed protein product [Cylicostephanus goldi]